MPDIPKDELSRIMKQVPIMGVEVIIKGERGILLGKRNTEPFRGLWHLPG